MKLVTELKENEVIHCKTEEEAVAICKLMHEAGLMWNSGRSYDTRTNYGENTCYMPEIGKFINFADAIEDGLTIYPASLFLTPPVSLTHTIGEYVAAQHDGKLYLFKGNQSMVLTKDIINHIKQIV